MSEAEVLLMPEALEDFQALDGSAKLIVLNALRKLIDSLAVVGNRTYRIIFRVEADNTVWVITVIAKRADDEVYRIALARLQLHEDERIQRLAVPLSELLGSKP